ncbi:hypothetical protein PENSPDRAFT_661051 [Peniophora sp. CONT]|nr:hypothetical protein PENSPDRAFT_661051 [Peniophora sp. CONT]
MAPKKPRTVPASRPAQPKDRKRTGPPKKVLSEADKAKKLYATLVKQLDGAHFPNALKTTDKLLALDPNDSDARQTKLFLLLQTDKYAQALDLLDHAPEGQDVAYERAYCLYRLQREEDADTALDELMAARPDDRGVQHLEAQLSYRQGEYGAAYDLYNSLLDSAEPGTDEHADITTNARAAHAHLDFVTSSYAGALDALPSAITSALESAPPPALPSASSSAIPAAATAPAPTTAPKRTVRTKRVPKGITPGVSPAPDPERWLKKTERSSYVPPRGKKRAGGGATQGFTPAVENVPSSAAGGGGGGKKKGKKK